MCLGKVWAESNCLLESFNGFRITPQLVINRSQVVERLRVIRLQADCFLISIDGLSIQLRRFGLTAALGDLEVSIAEVIVRYGIVRLQPDRLLQLGDGRSI